MNATAAPAAGVVVCTYAADRWRLLVRAIRSLLDQGEGLDEIVIVVDHQPELLERARRRWTGRATVIPNEFRPGLSGARNTGLAAIGSDIIAFVDDDAKVEAGWIRSLLSAFEDERVVACGGAVVAEPLKRPPEWWPPEFDWVIGCSYVGLPAKRAFVRNLIGANMAFRRRAVLEAGGFAEGMGRRGSDASGCEETDLCIRLAALDPSARVVYEPAAIVRHAVPADRLSWRYFRTRCYAEGLSKAMVARRNGAHRALSSERVHAARLLRRSIAHSLRGEGGPRRAAAIAAGLALTTAGYLRGRMHAAPDLA